MKKSRKEIQMEAVKAIIDGDLLLEEAMEKYHVKDKRTILSWMKKAIPHTNAGLDSNNSTALSTAERAININHLNEDRANSYTQDIARENELLKKVIRLQEKVQQLEEENGHLTRHRNLLMEKLTYLELRIQLKDKSFK